MAKKSQKRPVRHERDQSGCMWGLISMFDFRHGRPTQKLLSDRRRGTEHVVAAGNAMNRPGMLINLDENCQGTISGKESTMAEVDAGKPSVKKLMEEEMFSEKDLKKEINSAEVEQKQSNPEYGGHKRKNRKRTSRSCSKSFEIRIEDLDASENLESEKLYWHNSEMQSTKSLDIDDMMEEFCREIHHSSCLMYAQHDEVYDQASQKNPDFEEKLSEAVKLFISQRLINGKQFTGHGDLHSSKELKDALKILSSDEELSMKILQGPKSLMAKYVESLENAHVGKDEILKPLVGSSMSEQEIHDLKASDQVIHGKQRKFFRRKAKSPEKNALKENKASQASNKIVILKPGPTGLEKPESEGGLGSSQESQIISKKKGPNERAGSYFFFSEIKRRLRQAMGKEQQEISASGISNRFPKEHRVWGDNDKRYKENVGRNSPSKDHFFIEKIARPPSGVKRGEKTDRLKECEISIEHETANFSKERSSNIYVEAKKHLSDMLTSGTGDMDFSRSKVPKTLGRILSLPEYNFSPIGSPGRDWGQNFVSAQMRFSANDKFQKQENDVSHLGRMALNSDTELCASDGGTDNKVEASSNPNSSASNELVPDNEVGEISCSVGDGMTSEGDVDIIKVAETVVQKDSNVFDTLSEPSDLSTTRADRNDHTSEVRDAKICSEYLKHDLHDENQPLSSPLTSPSTSSITKKDDNPEGAVEILEWQSPVSVLEPLLTEEDVSRASTRFQPAELSIQPQRIWFEEHDPSAADLGTELKACVQDKESIFEYVKAVLQASGENWDEFYIVSNSSDPLLDPSVFDEVGFFPNQLCYGKKLLFDCVNEVLLEVYGRYFGCPLGLSFAKPNIRPAPDMKSVICEVWEGVHWYLLPLPLPHTLEQIVKKDMAKTGMWMELRCDTETLITETGEAIFKDLIEETILSCISECSDSRNSLIAAELKDKSSIVM